MHLNNSLQVFILILEPKALQNLRVRYDMIWCTISTGKLAGKLPA